MFGDDWIGYVFLQYCQEGIVQMFLWFCVMDGKMYVECVIVLIGELLQLVYVGDFYGDNWFVVECVFWWQQWFEIGGICQEVCCCCFDLCCWIVVVVVVDLLVWVRGRFEYDGYLVVQIWLEFEG